MDLYCSRGDVNAWLPAGEITGWSRVGQAVASDDTITLDGHGLETDTPVTVRAPEGSLPSPLAESTTYYVIRITNATFQLATEPGGEAINLTASADEIVVLREPPYELVIEFYSRWADGYLPAHLVPLEEPIHPLVRGLVAQLAAKALLNLDGKSSELVTQAELAAQKQLERHAIGLPLRGAPATAPSNLAVSAVSASSTSRRADPRGWGTGGRL